MPFNSGVLLSSRAVYPLYFTTTQYITNLAYSFSLVYGRYPTSQDTILISLSPGIFIVGIAQTISTIHPPIEIYIPPTTTIIGAGGRGGLGGRALPLGSDQAPAAGEAGFDAIFTYSSVRVYGGGKIYGGFGGGGGGAYSTASIINLGQGGGGGGGAFAGAGGSVYSGNVIPAVAGTASVTNVKGIGGLGGGQSSRTGGTGGNGGDPTVAAQAGQTASVPGGAAGARGNAIVTNTYPLTNVDVTIDGAIV